MTDFFSVSRSLRFMAGPGRSIVIVPDRISGLPRSTLVDTRTDSSRCHPHSKHVFRNGQIKKFYSGKFPAYCSADCQESAAEDKKTLQEDPCRVSCVKRRAGVGPLPFLSGSRQRRRTSW